MRLVVWFALAALSLQASDWYLFTSFRGNGEDGVYLALSRDGYVWEALNGNKPWLKPGHKGMLMRDPSIQAGPDHKYHMVWTSSWGKTDGELKIGYANSADLIHWSEQKLIPVMQQEPEGRNAWAPELFYDERGHQWLIFWATTIPGRFAATDKETEGPEKNHRIYVTTTRDFETFTPARLFFDPGFNVIDATILEANGKYVLVFKDERLHPVKKNIRMAFSGKAEGPYTGVTDPITGDWVEGPSAIKIGGDHLVYYDSYRKPQFYGAVRSRDLKTWEDVSKEMTFPKDHRHGTVIRIPEKLARQLNAARF